MNERKDVVTKVDWQKVLPCSMLKSTFGVAIRIPVLFLGMAAVLVTIGGSTVGQSLFISDGDSVDATTVTEPMALASDVASDDAEYYLFTCVVKIMDFDLSRPAIFLWNANIFIFFMRFIFLCLSHGL